jgi:nucleoside-diphosphate-sugar epimerase
MPVESFPRKVLEPAPDVVIHMIPMGERDGRALVETFRGRTARVVALSSGDVYQAYGREYTGRARMRISAPFTDFGASRSGVGHTGTSRTSAHAIVLAALHPAAAGIYNVGEEDPPTVAERLKNLPRSSVPDTAMPLNFEHNIAYDTSRIRRDLGYKEPIDYAEGLRRTLAASSGLRLKLAAPDKITATSSLAARVGQVLHGLARSLPRT